MDNLVPGRPPADQRPGRATRALEDLRSLLEERIRRAVEAGDVEQAAASLAALLAPPGPRRG